MAQFSKEEFDDLLLGLDISHESIVKSSSHFLNLEADGFELASGVFFDTFRNVIEHSILKDKVPAAYSDTKPALPSQRHLAESQGY